MVNTDPGSDALARTLVAELRALLGTKLVAYLAEAPDTATVRGWVDGTSPLPTQPSSTDSRSPSTPRAESAHARPPPSSKLGSKDETPHSTTNHPHSYSAKRTSTVSATPSAMPQANSPRTAPDQTPCHGGQGDALIIRVPKK